MASGSNQNHCGGAESSGEWVLTEGTVSTGAQAAVAATLPGSHQAAVAATPFGKLPRQELSPVVNMFAAPDNPQFTAPTDVPRKTTVDRSSGSTVDRSSGSNTDASIADYFLNSQTMLGIDYFFNFSAFTAGYKQHSAALKWFREFTEGAQLDPWEAAPILFEIKESPLTINQIVHPKGMNYHFDPRVKCKWMWQEMIAQMDEASIEFVVEGPEHMARGLIGCAFQRRPNSYDHKRMHANKSLPAVAGWDYAGYDGKLPIWDFVLMRDDGTAIRLRPQWSTTAVETYDVAGHCQPVAPPGKGLGKSDGPGTYKHYKTLGNKKTLKFDAAKRPR
jgi:hypothetical protein